ncbi:unnamed protein product [Ranitomeya imitator]|uniref:Rab3 GTPase-activating protein catalytic subunit n=1 Tax=Ranitomeya imitator TaxID=111125 RepID=A0ABN9LJZ1_9NEOB|nr:unnamed protein product [Ranitomeya imitator]
MYISSNGQLPTLYFAPKHLSMCKSLCEGRESSQVPIFVQIHQKWRKLYVGECQGPSVRTDFEMVHLRKVPNQYTHLSGLLDIFKSKIGCPLTALPPVNIAIRFTYVLQDWQQHFWPQQPPDTDDGGYTQSPDTDDGGYTQSPDTDDGGYGQSPDTDDGGYGWSPDTDDGGYGQSPDTDDGGYGWSPDTDDGGDEQSPDTDDGGYGWSPDTDDGGDGQSPDTDDGGYRQSPDTDDGGDGKSPDTDDGGDRQSPDIDDGDIDAVVGGEVGGLEFGKLPFGACEDPISELHLATTWPCLTEGIIVDNDVYSDLDPLQAPQWSVRVRKADNPQCMLGDFISEFFRLCRRKESTDELLGKSAFDENGKDAADIGQALSKLTEPAPVPIHKLSVTGMVSSARKKIRKHRGADETPLSNDVLNAILFFLFPDAKSLDGAESRTSVSNSDTAAQAESEDYNLYSQLKSAPSDSLTYKLALCLCMVNFYHGGVRGVAHLWQEFVLEMRYRWENNHLVPGLTSGPPDLKCCLLHQKLQMLNCCIERKKARDNVKKGGTPDSSNSATHRLANDSINSAAESEKNKYEVGKSWDSWSDSEDEFFECHSDTEEMKESSQEEAKKKSKEEVKELLKPDGRLHQSGNLTLLQSAEPLYVPITQVTSEPHYAFTYLPFLRERTVIQELKIHPGYILCVLLQNVVLLHCTKSCSCVYGTRSAQVFSLLI